MERRRDNKGRILRNGEVQRPDGMYMFRYTDSAGKRRTVYSWKLVGTDRLREGQRDVQSLRDKEKRILKDLDDKVQTNDAEHTTADDLFLQFMDIRKDLEESTRCCYNGIYGKHIRPVIGGKPIGKIKPTEIQKRYQSMVSDGGVNPTTLLRERDKKRGNSKKFVVDGYTDVVFLNNNGQVYTQSFIYDAIQGITTSYNKEEYTKALEENRQPYYLPKISAQSLRHTFCTRMCENDVNIKVLQDIMGHRNIRTTMETYAKALKDKQVETIQALNGAFKIS